MKIQTFIYVMTLSAFLTVGFTGQAYAGKSFWHYLFPYVVSGEEKEEEVPQPERTLVAPFAEEKMEVKPTVSPDNKLVDLYAPPQGPIEDGVTTQLSSAHRNPTDISEWLIKAVSEIFDIDVDDYQGHLDHLSTGMSPNAINEFNNFIGQSRTYEVMTQNNMQINSFVEEDPLLLNQAVLAGRYRWLFEMPVTLTFIPEGTNNYRAQQPQNQRVIVTVQVGRVAKGQGINELMIETFAVKKNPNAE